MDSKTVNVGVGVAAAVVVHAGTLVQVAESAMPPTSVQAWQFVVQISVSMVIGLDTLELGRAV